MKKNYVGDFETATWFEDETYVWAWAVCEIGNEDHIEINNSIETFFDFCKKEKNPVIYFHNLKFDGSFIISYLLENGYKHIKDKKERDNLTFTTLISAGFLGVLSPPNCSGQIGIAFPSLTISKISLL